jgi:DNA mismatch endonuclease (patch repair protein)
MDNLTVAQRRFTMSRVRGSGTGPEMTVRKALHRLGYRYVLHDKRLPGVPDLVFPSREKIIFVHGCFWHQHENCRYGNPPSTRVDFWLPKLAANRARDKSNLAKLRRLGWKVMVVWECELKTLPKTIARMVKFLES